MIKKNKNINSNTEPVVPGVRSQTSNSNQSRRRFLKKVWSWLGVIAGMEVVGITTGFLLTSRKNLAGSAQNLLVAGNVSDFKMNSVFPFRSGKFYLVRMADGGFLAVSLKCSHLGCSVLWNEEKKEFICPCHASSFDLMGSVINAPAPRPLDTFPVIIEEGKVKVDIGTPVRRIEFDNSQITYA
jgi:cytochrome b6-f complex iron-sulfur subunit